MAKLVVGVAEMAVSGQVTDEIVTYALGSCLGLAIYDPAVRVGGVLHFMLPSSAVDRERAECRPCIFADTGIQLLLKELGKLGAGTGDRLVVKVAGGAQIMDERGLFDVGKRNHMALQKMFSGAGIMIDAEDIGGRKARTMSMGIANGAVWISSSGNKVQL